MGLIVYQVDITRGPQKTYGNCRLFDKLIFSIFFSSQNRSNDFWDQKLIADISLKIRQLSPTSFPSIDISIIFLSILFFCKKGGFFRF